jgi:hypothetical protein
MVSPHSSLCSFCKDINALFEVASSYLVPSIFILFLFLFSILCASSAFPFCIKTSLHISFPYLLVPCLCLCEANGFTDQLAQQGLNRTDDCFLDLNLITGF